MIPATNQLGYEIQRHDGPSGWTAIVGPFATKVDALFYKHAMAKVPGAEYRVYPALAKRSAA